MVLWMLDVLAMLEIIEEELLDRVEDVILEELREEVVLERLENDEIAGKACTETAKRARL